MNGSDPADQPHHPRAVTGSCVLAAELPLLTLKVPNKIAADDTVCF